MTIVVLEIIKIVITFVTTCIHPGYNFSTFMNVLLALGNQTVLVKIFYVIWKIKQYIPCSDFLLMCT